MTLVHCHGTFSYLHYGHLCHLRAAKAMGGDDARLWVTITADRFVKKPYCQPEQERWEMLKSLRVVDLCTIIYDEGPEVAIRSVVPDIYVKGMEYAGRLREQALVEQLGGRVAFTYDEYASKIKTGKLLRLISGRAIGAIV